MTDKKDKSSWKKFILITSETEVVTRGVVVLAPTIECAEAMLDVYHDLDDAVLRQKVIDVDHEVEEAHVPTMRDVGAYREQFENPVEFDFEVLETLDDDELEPVLKSLGMQSLDEIEHLDGVEEVAS